MLDLITLGKSETVTLILGKLSEVGEYESGATGWYYLRREHKFICARHNSIQNTTPSHARVLIG